jgi:hypothetical protein
MVFPANPMAARSRMPGTSRRGTRKEFSDAGCESEMEEAMILLRETKVFGVSYQGTLEKNPNFTANANAKATSTAQVSREKVGFLAEFEVVRSDILIASRGAVPT